MTALSTKMVLSFGHREAAVLRIGPFCGMITLKKDQSYADDPQTINHLRIKIEAVIAK